MGRAPCCDKANVKKGPWSPEEDAKLKEFIEKFGTGGNWIALPQKAGLKRCGKSCRLRWLNYLRPNIRHGEFSDDEDRIICSLYASIGSRWSVIAAQLPGRTDNDIKNYWNTKLKKKLMTMLPSVQEKEAYFPFMPFQPQPQPPPLPYDHHTSEQFLNTSSAVCTSTPNFMNANSIFVNSLFLHDDHVNVTTDLQTPPPHPPANNLMRHNSIDVNDTLYNNLGFQEDHQSMCNSPMQEYFHSATPMKEGMPMFASSTSSSSESMSQISTGSYNKTHHNHHQQYQIKQEDYQINFHDDQVLGGQIPYNSFMIKDHVTPLLNDVEEVKPLNYNNHLFHDGETNTCYQEMSYYYW